jgi:hypothetical protein
MEQPITFGKFYGIPQGIEVSSENGLNLGMIFRWLSVHIYIPLGSWQS